MEDKILKFRPDTVPTVRRLHNLDRPGDLDQLIDSLQDWLRKQHHLTKKKYSREYLERSIIMTKGSVERAKAQLDKLCSLKTLLPKFFQNYNARNGYEGLTGIYAAALLPQLTEDHNRIYILKVLGSGLTKKLFFDAVTFNIFFLEYIRAYDYSNGIIAILDYRDVVIGEFVSSIDFGDIQSFVTILMNGYAMRIKGVHVITSLKALKSVIDIVKNMFGPKMASRFHVHADVEALYRHVPKNILPSELDGDERSLVTLFEEWKDVLSTKENIEYLKEMSQAGSNEAGKMKENLNVDLGLAGTFRSLAVD